MDFRTRRVDDIAPTLTSPLLFGLIDNIHQLKKPEIPGKPASFKEDKGLWGLGWALPKPDALGHPDQFTAESDWVPLYTKDSLEKHLPATLSTFTNSEPPSLTAVVPPNFHVGIDREFLLTNFHWHGCLVRQSISIGGKCRQMAFCPYCRVINENSETALLHVRRHLDLLFVCGGCYSRSFPHGQTLYKHMKSQCCSVMAIRDKTRSSQR